MRGFDKQLHKLLKAHPEAALEHAKLFAELPLPTQLAIMRRRTMKRRATRGKQEWQTLFNYGRRKAHAAGIRTEADVERLIDASRKQHHQRSK